MERTIAGKARGRFLARRRTKPRKRTTAPISMGAEVWEDLPLPYVHYPGHYGTFIAFSLDETSPIMLCSCAQLPVENYIRLRRMQPPGPNYYPLRMAPLGSLDFPEVIAERSLRYKNSPAESISFSLGLCHRCNLSTPSLRYCHEMYGGKFKQSFGWYINQSRLRVGISLHSGTVYLSDRCPIDLQTMFQELQSLHRSRESIANLILNLGQSLVEIRSQLHDIDARTSKLGRQLDNKIENITRQEFGVRKVGEAWVSETLLLNIVRRLLPDDEVIHHYHPDWLEGLELDIFVPRLSLAIEYQGQQHFHAIATWGGEESLKANQERDRLKVLRCSQASVTLVTVDYTEPLTEDYIRQVIAKAIP